MKRFSPNLKLKAFFFVFLAFSSIIKAQVPTVLGTDVVNGFYTTYDLATVGGFKQFRVQATSGAATGVRKWEFTEGTSGSASYTNNWRPYTGSNILSVNTYIPTSFANGAKYNTSFGGSSGLLPTVTTNNYYTFNVSNLAAADQVMSLLETSYNPVSISSVTQSAGSFASRTVSITTSGTPSSGENLFVRYSKDGFVSSTLVQATGSGTSWTANIPWQSSAVSFYVYSSNKSLSAINSDVSANGQSAHDMSVLNLNNNAGANYSWTPATGSIIVTSSGGSLANTPTAYSNFTLAGGLFSVLNTGTAHTGTVTAIITADITTETGANSLNSSATWTSLMVNPQGARTVSGNVAVPLINLKGADNVTFDGLNSGGNSLTISNTNTSATSGTSTIQFIDGATSNTITNCSVLGSATMSVATNGGNIFFSTDGSTANGNDNNTISNCNIGPAGANLPTKGIYGNGSTGTTAIGNSGITINNNNIFDYFGAGVTSSGIATGGGCNTWSITNNKFYQTGTRTFTSGVLHNAINIQNTGTGGAQGFTITGNTIGFANSTGTSTYTLVGGANAATFRAIQFNGISGGTANSINSNTIANISLTGVISSGTQSTGPFIGIFINEGTVNTNNNIIGSQSATGSLVFTTSTGTATEVQGIYNHSSDNWVSNGNQIGGFSSTNNGSGAFVFIGIRANTLTSKTWAASSNIIGGTVANSIQLSAANTASQLIGMGTNTTSAPVGTFTQNTVRNLTTNIGTGTVLGASMIGIVLASVSNQTVSQNTIFNLTNSNTTAASTVTGIHMNGLTNTVDRNFIYGLTAATNSGTAEVSGIRVAGGTTVYKNNMIALGAGINNGIRIFGINEQGGTDQFLHNSIYIGGSPTSGTISTFAFNSSITNTRNFSNNIFVNARSNSGTATGKNYTVSISSVSGLTMDFNVFNSSGTGAVFGSFGGADVTNLANWKTTVGKDANSLTGDPQYIAPSATTPDLHISASNPTPVEAQGTTSAVTDDFDGQTRTGLTPVDIGADAGNFVSTIAACVAPSSQATNLLFSGITTSSITGTYTAASPAVSGYVVLRNTSPAVPSVTPVDATTYAAGATLGNATVVFSGTGLTYTNNTGLTAGTSYTYTVYTFNNTACTGGPKYNITTPLQATQATACSSATALAAGSITPSGANITWTGAGNYIVEYGAAGFTPGTGASAGTGGTIASSTATTPYALTGLSSSTTYDVYVRQVCALGGLYSANSTKANFTTTQVPASLDYTDGFEGTNNWTLVNGSQTNMWFVGTAAANGGTKGLYISSNASGTNNNYANTTSVTQAFRDVAIPVGVNTAEILFDWRAVGEIFLGSPTDFLTVWLVPTSFTPTAGNAITAGAGRIQLATALNQQADWQNFTNFNVDVSSFAGQTMRLVFEWDNDNVVRNQTAAAIDNVIVRKPCAAQMVSVTNGSNCGPGTVTLGAVGNASTTEYHWYSDLTGGTLLQTTTTGSWSPNVSGTSTFFVAASTGSCESSIRKAVTATVTPTPNNITINPTISPVGADACATDFVKLDATGNPPSTLLNEGWNALSTQFVLDKTSGTTATATLDTTFHSEGTSALRLKSNGGTDAKSGFIAVNLITGVDLTKYSAATLTFDHICATQKTFDFGVLVYSLDGGNSWYYFSPSDYVGTATLKQGLLSFDASSYSDWNTNFTGSSSTPLNTLWKSETVNLTPYLGYSDFIISFEYDYNNTTDFYGWLVDNIKINGTPPKITWSPITGLYSDMGLATPYVNGTDATTVYAAPNGNQTYTATASVGTSCTKTAMSTVNDNKKMFTGAVDNTWSNANNWFPNVVPDNTKCANIPSSKTVLIDVDNAQAKSLTIASTGKVSINANKSLSVTDAINITNNASNDNLVLESDANLLQTNSALPNTGNILAKRGVHMRKMDYTYWSTPVTGQKLLNDTSINDGFSVGTPNNRVYYYNEPNDTFKPVPSTETTFGNAKGYAIRGKDGYLVTDPTNNPVADEFKFIGTPNNGAYSINIQKSANTGTGGVVEHGYNLIGNPYPSNIDFVKFFNLGNNSNIINAKAWFWSNVTPTINQQGSGYSGNNYATITLSGGTPPTYSDTTVTPESTGSYIPTKNIKVGQAFIIQAKNLGTSQTLTFDNTIRTNESGVFFNNKNSSGINRYWVKLTSPENIVNTILLAHIDGATNGYDANYDAELLTVGDDSFYSKLNTQKLQIQARKNPLDTEDVILLGNKYSTNGIYKISLGNREGIFVADQKIYLKDKLTNTYTDLTTQDYTFTASKGTDETRFEIVYKDNAVLATDGVKKSDFTVYRDGEYFVIKSSSNLGRVELYDVSGKLITSKSVSQKELRLNAATIPSGVYVVKAENSGNVRTKKIIK